MEKFFLIIFFLSASFLWSETLYLRNNRIIKAEILKQDHERVIIDLGFQLLQIPKSQILKIEKESSQKPISIENKRALYSMKGLKEASISEKVKQFGEAVVKVSTPSGLGSGFVIHKKGYVVTNFHVIERERRIVVTLFKQRGNIIEKVKYPFVKIIAINPLIDLALLKITTDPKKPKQILPEFKIVYLGKIDEVEEGNKVFCIGNPLGMERSVSDGIISSKQRQLRGLIYLQCTAAINPGNSGGPLFNSKGQVIGITNMKVMFADNLGFAIPVHYLKDFLKNRDAFAFDKEKPNSGVVYFSPPRKKAKK